MILVDHYLQLGIKDTPYYGEDIDAVIEDIATAYQTAIQDLYEHGCRYLQIDDTSWTYLIDDEFMKKYLHSVIPKMKYWNGLEKFRQKP